MEQNHGLSNTMDGRGWPLHLIILGLIHPNLDHMPPDIWMILAPIENDGPHHFMLKKDP